MGNTAYFLVYEYESMKKNARNGNSEFSTKIQIESST